MQKQTKKKKLKKIVDKSSKEFNRLVKIQLIRKILNVPKKQRIGQYIMNQFYQDYKIMGKKIGWGIDIFDIQDEEFIKKLTNQSH